MRALFASMARWNWESSWDSSSFPSPNRTWKISRPAAACTQSACAQMGKQRLAKNVQLVRLGGAVRPNGGGLCLRESRCAILQRDSVICHCWCEALQTPTDTEQGSPLPPMRRSAPLAPREHASRVKTFPPNTSAVEENEAHGKQYGECTHLSVQCRTSILQR